MASSSPRCATEARPASARTARRTFKARACRCGGALLLAALTACGSDSAGRAEIEQLQVLGVGPGATLQIQQRLDFSPLMLDALSNGIGLRLDYRLAACSAEPVKIYPLWLRYYPLAGEFELRWQTEASGKRFARRSALLAALDQVRLALPESAARCGGELSMRLEPAALPAPLRFPALIGLQDWRLEAAAVAFSPAAGAEP